MKTLIPEAATVLDVYKRQVYLDENTGKLWADGKMQDFHVLLKQNNKASFYTDVCTCLLYTSQTFRLFSLLNGYVQKSVNKRFLEDMYGFEQEKHEKYYAADCICCFIPVSYTHLDVYKRQVYLLILL